MSLLALVVQGICAFGVLVSVSVGKCMYVCMHVCVCVCVFYTLNSLSSRCPLISASAELFSLSDLMCACTSTLSLVISCSVPPPLPAGLVGGGGRCGFDGGIRGACHIHVHTQ